MEGVFKSAIPGRVQAAAGFLRVCPIVPVLSQGRACACAVRQVVQPGLRVDGVDTVGSTVFTPFT